MLHLWNASQPFPLRIRSSKVIVQLPSPLLGRVDVTWEATFTHPSVALLAAACRFPATKIRSYNWSKKATMGGFHGGDRRAPKIDGEKFHGTSGTCHENWMILGVPPFVETSIWQVMAMYRGLLWNSPGAWYKTVGVILIFLPIKSSMALSKCELWWDTPIFEIVNHRYFLIRWRHDHPAPVPEWEQGRWGSNQLRSLRKCRKLSWQK